MRSIKTYLVVAMITITILSADAQAPGYLGKRFMVNYDLYTFPAISNPNVNGEKGISSFNIRHVFSVDYVTGLNHSVGLSFHLTKTQFEFKREFNFTYQYMDGYGEKETTTELIYFGDLKGELSAYAIGLHTNLYFNQFLAPLGTYFKPEILLVNFRATFDSDLANKYLRDNINHAMLTFPVLANKKAYTTVAIGATLGTHYIFYDRLIVNIGFQVGWVVGGKKMSEWMENDGLVSDKINEDNFIPISAKSRLMSQYFINIDAGIWLLIF